MCCWKWPAISAIFCFLRVYILLDELVAAPLTYASELPAAELYSYPNATEVEMEPT